jgi:hypothetical protein
MFTDSDFGIPPILIVTLREQADTMQACIDE